MNRPPHRDNAAVHDISCAQRIRVLRLAQAGDPAPPPPGLLQAIAAEIGSCCGQPLLRAHRLAWGWTVSAALRAVRDQHADGPGHQGVSLRAWQDWEAGKRPNRHNQDLLCRLFETGPVELGFARDYREGDTAGSTGLDRTAAGSTAQPTRPAQPASPMTGPLPAPPERGGAVAESAPGRPAALPGDHSLARLFRDYGQRWEIERVERGTEWVAVLRQARRDHICIVGARDLGALRYKISQAEREEAGQQPADGQDIEG